MLRGDGNHDDCMSAALARLRDNGREGSMTAGNLAANRSIIVAAFNDAVVSECIREEVRVEARFDALVFRIAEELRNGGGWDSPRVTEHLAELPSMEVKYENYEALEEISRWLPCLGHSGGADWVRRSIYARSAGLDFGLGYKL